jgi:hypothetical protein
MPKVLKNARSLHHQPAYLKAIVYTLYNLPGFSIAKDRILQTANGKPMGGERIAFLAENGYDYVGAHWIFHGAEQDLIPEQSRSSPSLPMMP